MSHDVVCGGIRSFRMPGGDCDGIEDHALFTIAKAAEAAPSLPCDEAHTFTADEQRTARFAAIDALEKNMK